MTVAPLTLPAHASILTGLYPPNHGVRTNGHRLNTTQQTLAEVLHGAGYATAAFVSSFVLDPRFGLNRGFDRYDAAVDPTLDDAFGAGNERSAGAVTSAALDWVRARDVSRPFFLWVHYFDPHHLYRPPAEFGLRFADRPYDGEIAYMDSQIGRLVKGLEDGGIAGRTLIVASGDHGESLGDHGERFHARTVYESAIHVPLILAAPGLIRQGAVAEAVVSLVDVFPTALQLLGVGTNQARDGSSLVDAARAGDRIVYLEAAATYLDNGWAPLHAVRTDTEKYIEAPRPEYYDLAVDPGERDNRFRAGSSSARLAAHLQDLAGRWPSLPLTKVPQALIDPEARSRLAALGYVSRGPGGPPGSLADPKDMLPAYEQMIEAQAMMAAGRYEEALARLGKVLIALPNDREALHRLGEIYAHLNRLEDAERTLRRSMSINVNPPVATLLAQVLTKMKRYDEASQLLDQAAAIDPMYGAVYIARGDLLALQGKPAAAIPLYRRALEVDPYRSAGVVRARTAAVQARLRPAGANGRP